MVEDERTAFWATAWYCGLRSRSVSSAGGCVGAEPVQSDAPTAACSDHDPCIPQRAGQSLATPARAKLSAGMRKGDGWAPARREPRQV